jgi:hypothetical protein
MLQKTAMIKLTKSFQVNVMPPFCLAAVTSSFILLNASKSNLKVVLAKV